MHTNLPHETETRLGLVNAQGRDGSSEVIPAPRGAGPSSRRYTIREMAREFQVTIRTLRFYDDRGLLRPSREGGVRRYDDRDHLHLRMILKGKRLGFTLAEIHDILVGRGEEYGKAELEMVLTPEQIAAQISHLEQQRGQIENAIENLREAQRRLSESTPARDGASPSGRQPV
jgi:DNA-binding transcriptional MerR regulator